MRKNTEKTEGREAQVRGKEKRERRTEERKDEAQTETYEVKQMKNEAA